MRAHPFALLAGLAAACADQTPFQHPMHVILDSGDDSIVVLDVAVDADRVYAAFRVAQTGCMILACPRAGCSSPKTLLENEACLVHRLAADGDTLYWTEESSGTGRVMRRASDGSGDAVEVSSTSTAPCGVVVDAEAVYWSSCGGGIFKSDKSGAGGAQPLVVGGALTQRLVMAGERLYWLEGDALKSARRDGTDLVELGRMENGGAAAALLPGLAVVDDSVVWASLASDGKECRIRRTPIAGGGDIWSHRTTWPGSVVATEESVYWLSFPEYSQLGNAPQGESSNARIVRADVGGGGAETLVETEGLGSLAAFEGVVYWSFGRRVDAYPE